MFFFKKIDPNEGRISTNFWAHSAPTFFMLIFCLRTIGWGGLGWCLGVDGAGGWWGVEAKREEREEDEAGRACGERAEGVGTRGAAKGRFGTVYLFK